MNYIKPKTTVIKVETQHYQQEVQEKELIGFVVMFVVRKIILEIDFFQILKMRQR